MFEIRAAVPTSVGLSGEVMLIPEDGLNKTISSEFFILKNINRSAIFGHIHYLVKLPQFGREIKLEHFQIYRFRFDPVMNVSTLKYTRKDQVHTKVYVHANMPNVMQRMLWQGKFRLVFNLLIR